MYIEAYKKLERSLTDNIAEAQAKLGYSKNTMQFYYPLRTLNHFFNSEWEADEMNKALQGFIDFVVPRFGETRIEYKEHRFCFERSGPTGSRHSSGGSPPLGLL